MEDVLVKRANVNLGQLQEEVGAVFGADVVGVSAGPYGVRVHVARELKDAERARIAELVAAHVPRPVKDPRAAQIAALRGRAWSKLPPEEQDAAWALVFAELFGEAQSG